MSKQRSQGGATGKARQLWQIFFDDDDKQEEGATSGKYKPTVLLDQSRANRSHGVLYQGLLDAESDSDEQDVTQGMLGTSGAPSADDPGDLTFKDQKKVAFAKSDAESNGNSVQNYNKPFNAREWEAVEFTPRSSRPTPQRLSQEGGARFIIRSESDLELAIPANQRPRRRYCCCIPDKGSQSQTFEYATCVLLSLVAMTALYVAIVICIVYGFK